MLRRVIRPRAQHSAGGVTDGVGWRAGRWLGTGVVAPSLAFTGERHRPVHRFCPVRKSEPFVDRLLQALYAMRIMRWCWRRADGLPSLWMSVEGLLPTACALVSFLGCFRYTARVLLYGEFVVAIGVSLQLWLPNNSLRRGKRSVGIGTAGTTDINITAAA